MFVIFSYFFISIDRPEESDTISTYWLKIDVDDKISNQQNPFIYIYMYFRSENKVARK